MRSTWHRFDPGLAAAVVVLLWLAGCTIVPETGRRQFILFTPAQEQQLGLTAFTQLKQQVPINKDPALNAMVQRVGRRVADVAGMPDAQWEFVVFESREVNAFCLPGGKVGIYTGILPITKDEAGLATVIGHEVAHAARRHGAERLTLGLPVQVGGEVVNAYMNANDPKHQQAAATVYGVATKLLLELPHSRTQESEADKVGLFFMARAGYPPAAAVSFWERFAAHNRQAGGGGPGFLRTHPLDERRIQDLKTWLPEAQPLYRGP